MFFIHPTENQENHRPVGEQSLQTPEEQQAARAEDAEARAAQETIARQKAEAEVERLREQLARLQART